MQKAEGRRQTIVVAIGVILYASALLADGGKLQSSQRFGDMQVSIFTLPAVPSAGLLDLSVLVQDSTSGRVRNGANVKVELEQIDPPMSMSPIRLQQSATSQAATNKLFQAALFDLPATGRWKANVTVEDQPAAAFEFVVGDPLPGWLEIAPWIAWPLVIIALFAIHQYLKRNCRCSAEVMFA
jgi:hypothetical protein